MGTKCERITIATDVIEVGLKYDRSTIVWEANAIVRDRIYFHYLITN
jgi:hypothetical protein